MEHFDDFVERVREGNPIEEVMRESGITLKGHGKMLTGSKHDSLKVRTDWQRAWWYSSNWNGDVFGWVMRDKGVDFMGALEILARRANLEMPKFSSVNESEVVKQRATADVFSVAASVFQRWLIDVPGSTSQVPSDEEALVYARSRGWTDETIKASMLGFSGRKTEAQIKDMRGEFDLWGIDALSPAAVAVTGFEGDVDAWAKSKGVREHPDFDEKWIEWKKIYGLMDTPGLVYVHQFNGGVRYLSRRNLPGHDSKTKSFNPQKALAGAKQPYFNHAHELGKAIVLCEGQGDAVTWGQWGYGAMAFCGLLADLDSLSDDERERMMKLAKYINRHSAVYVALDEDKAGEEALHLAAALLGAKVQVVRMSKAMPREDASSALRSAQREDIEENNEA